MPDIINLIKKWWKQIIAVVFISMILAGAILFLKPNQYLSVATAVPASSFAADKSVFFNENIQSLYSTLGTPDDLDMILGTASLDTVYLAITDDFNLYDHYKIKETGNEARTKASVILKKNTRVIKSEYGNLKVKVWDTDKTLAPQLANSIMEKLQSIHQNLQSAGNEFRLKSLLAAKEKTQTGKDSTGTVTDKLKQYEKLIAEYQLMVDTKPLSLIIIEKAKVSGLPDKPKRIQLLTATAILSFLFALLIALLLERKNNL